MDTKDIGMRLYSKDPIFVDGVPIYPVSLREIAKIGYRRYSTELRILCLTESDVQALSGKDISNRGIFSFLVTSAIKDKDTMQAFLFLLSKITHSKVVFLSNKMCFSGGFFEITKDNFSDVQEIIRLRNGLQYNDDDEDENPDNEAARRVLQRRKEERLKRRKAKISDEDSEITLEDLISILSSGLGLLMDSVLEYDLYQFNDQFNRLKIMDDYQVNIQALLHGAKKEDINLVHWITKIKRNQE